MNIGISARAFMIDEPGGAAQTGMKLTRELANQDEHIRLFGYKNVARQFPEIPVTSTGYISDSLPYGLLWEQTVLPPVAKRENIDLLFCPNTYCPIRDTEYEKVVVIHSLTSYHGFSPGLYARFRRFAVPRAVEAADAVIAVSEYMREEIIDRLNTSREKTHVVHNGIDHIYLDDTPSTSVDCLPEEYLLYVGALSENKNVDGTLAAYQRLKEEYGIEQKLVLVGSTSNPTIETISESDLGSDVVLPGYINDERRLKYIYQNASVFLFPSHYESFGMPPLEAMACETPVVATDRTAVPEICDGAAHLIDPDRPDLIAKGVNRVLTDDKYAAKLVERGHERAQQFTWKASADALADVFEEVV